MKAKNAKKPAAKAKAKSAKSLRDLPTKKNPSGGAFREERGDK